MSKPLFTDILDPELSGLLDRVREKIITLVQDSPDMIREDLELLTARPGKMLRPLFLLIAAQGGSAEEDDLVSVAAAVELLHISSLAHDDVLDNAARRRGVETLHHRKGVKRAVLAGDYLLSLSVKLASSHFRENLVPYMIGGIERLCLSEIEQDQNTGFFGISREDYYRRIRGKTAELFALSLFAGALLGGQSEEARDALYQAGIDFGMAFQIQDDVLDYRGNPRTMGKNGSSDLKSGIPTLPLILALEENLPGLPFMLKPGIRTICSPLIRRKLIQKGYDEQSLDLAADFLRKSLTAAQTCLSPEGMDQYRSLLNALGNRIL
ncbi:MAG: polyprenyl synthetase family protein [Spirochaetales bacterium]|nr:polyprenyl synthetase family protein [Spirochaetales bacterium]